MLTKQVSLPFLASPELDHDQFIHTEMVDHNVCDLVAAPGIASDDCLKYLTTLRRECVCFFGLDIWLILAVESTSDRKAHDWVAHYPIMEAML